MNETIRVDALEEAIRAYCDTQPIRKLSLFGSDFDDWLRPDTDVGMLVEYLAGASITYVDMSRQERELGEIIGGTVDLRTPNEVERHMRRKLINGATLVFTQDSRE